jgi:hypothetical protein
VGGTGVLVGKGVNVTVGGNQTTVAVAVEVAVALGEGRAGSGAACGSPLHPRQIAPMQTIIHPTLILASLILLTNLL